MENVFYFCSTQLCSFTFNLLLSTLRRLYIIFFVGRRLVLIEVRVYYAVQIHHPENNSFLEGSSNLDHNSATQLSFLYMKVYMSYRHYYET